MIINKKSVGRPPLPKGQKKRMVAIRLPEEIIQWLDNQDKTKTELIGEAIRKTYFD